MPWSLAAVVTLVGAGAALLAGEVLLVRTEDLAALYWIATGAVMLRTTMALVAKRSP